MKPSTRENNFLAEIAGDVDADESMVPRTQKEIYLNKIAERLDEGGGGAGLPVPTAADVGKTMMVQAVEADGDVIVPEQTVAYNAGLDYFVPVLNVDADKFAEGAEVKLTINGESIVGTVADGWIVNVANTMGFGNDEGDWVAYYVPGGESPESITIKVVAVTNAYQWMPAFQQLVCHNVEGLLDHTCKEVMDAINNGISVYVFYPDANYEMVSIEYITRVFYTNNAYKIYVNGDANSAAYIADTIDDYPYYND